MKFRTFLQNKLWRDKAIEFLEKHGSKVHWNILNDEEFAQELKNKFLEEAHEVSNAKNKKELMEELADILEVMDALCSVHSFSLEEIVCIKEKKCQERGGFHGRKFVTKAEHPIGSLGERYCLAAPEKYPEIID